MAQLFKFFLFIFLISCSIGKKTVTDNYVRKKVFSIAELWRDEVTRSSDYDGQKLFFCGYACY